MRHFDQVVRVASKQHGVIARAQLVKLGVDNSAIQRAYNTGRLEVMHPGVYRLPGTRPTREAHLWAALHLAGEGAVLSRLSAGWHWRLEGLGKSPPSVIHVSIPVRRRVSKNHLAIDVRRTRSLVLGKDYGLFRGLPVTSLARTLVDLSGELSERNLEHAFDCVVRRDEENRNAVIAAIFRLGFGRPQTAALTKIAERQELGCTQSWLEDEVRQVLRAEGIPLPIPQLAIPDRRGRQIGIFDFAWPGPNVALMVDGWEFHKPREIFEKDRRQSAQLSSIGWHPFPVTYRRLEYERADFLYELRGALGLLVDDRYRDR